MKNISFRANNPEKSEYNQYWFSEFTVETIVEELVGLGAKKVAFLSTPSVFFCAQDREIEGTLFDVDETLACKVQEPNRFVQFDFRISQEWPSLHEKFDAVLVDPPFITPDVMLTYANRAKSLIKRGGRVLWTSTAENESVLKHLFGNEMHIHAVRFRPSIPSLVYQYNLYINYVPDKSSGFCQLNPEVS